jgi:hypothetical protein
MICQPDSMACADDVSGTVIAVGQPECQAEATVAEAEIANLHTDADVSSKCDVGSQQLHDYDAESK